MDNILYTFVSLLWAVIFILSNCSTIPKCERGFKGCCPDYSWDVESQKCQKCLPGYGGINCTKCPFPYYGEKCQGSCQCSMELCHISQGCPITSTESEELSTVSSIEVENHTIWTTGISTYTQDTSSVPTKEHFSINIIILILIKVFGFVDIVMILTCVAICIYDRKYTSNTRELRDTVVTFTENNSMYENVQIILPRT